MDMSFKTLLNSVFGHKAEEEDPNKDILDAFSANHEAWDKFPLGKTQEGKEVFWNPVASPHLLIAGRAGKDELIRNLIVHTRQHADKWNMSFIRIFKKGDIANLEDVLSSVKKTEEDIAQRLSEMKKNGVKDYRAMPEMTGEIIVIEECQWIFLNENKGSDRTNEKRREQIQESLKRIAILGFECGVHLILGTGKTPNSVFDTQFKELFPTHIVTEKLLENDADRKFLEMRDSLPSGKLSYLAEDGIVTTYRPYVSHLTKTKSSLLDFSE